MRPRTFTVKAEKVYNTTATISMRGSYAIFKPLLDRMGYATEHSISFSFTTETEA